MDYMVLRDFDHKIPLETECAAEKFIYTDFMTPEEIKELKTKPQLPKLPKYFDLSKAERVVITQEDIEEAQQKQAAQQV